MDDRRAGGGEAAPQVVRALAQMDGTGAQPPPRVAERIAVYSAGVERALADALTVVEEEMGRMVPASPRSLPKSRWICAGRAAEGVALAVLREVRTWQDAVGVLLRLEENARTRWEGAKGVLVQALMDTHPGRAAEVARMPRCADMARVRWPRMLVVTLCTREDRAPWQDKVYRARVHAAGSLSVVHVTAGMLEGDELERVRSMEVDRRAGRRRERGSGRSR